MRKAVLFTALAVLSAAFVYADSLFTPQTIDLGIIPGKTGEPLHEEWYRVVQGRFCATDSALITLYPLGDVNCDGRVNPVDAVLILRKVYLGESYPECRL